MLNKRLAVSILNTLATIQTNASFQSYLFLGVISCTHSDDIGFCRIFVSFQLYKAIIKTRDIFNKPQACLSVSLKIGAWLSRERKWSIMDFHLSILIAIDFENPLPFYLDLYTGIKLYGFSKLTIGLMRHANLETSWYHIYI